MAAYPTSGSSCQFMNTSRKISAILGFVFLGLSPSFVDWEQSPDKRPQMIAFYAIGIALIWYGLSFDK